MQMSTAIDVDNGNMVVKRVSVPVGLEELMENLTKEVIIRKPKDIYSFASHYFAELLNLREKDKVPENNNNMHTNFSNKQAVNLHNERNLYKNDSLKVTKVKQLPRQASTRQQVVSPSPNPTQNKKSFAQNDAYVILDESGIHKNETTKTESVKSTTAKETLNKVNAAKSDLSKGNTDNEDSKNSENVKSVAQNGKKAISNETANRRKIRDVSRSSIASSDSNKSSGETRKREKRESSNSRLKRSMTLPNNIDGSSKKDVDGKSGLNKRKTSSRLNSSENKTPRFRRSSSVTSSKSEELPAKSNTGVEKTGKAVSNVNGEIESLEDVGIKENIEEESKESNDTNIPCEKVVRTNEAVPAKNDQVLPESPSKFEEPKQPENSDTQAPEADKEIISEEEVCAQEKVVQLESGTQSSIECKEVFEDSKNEPSYDEKLAEHVSKDTNQENTISENNSSEETAASKIQSFWRKVRDLRKQQMFGLQNPTESEATVLSGIQLKNAAIVIQSLFRGYLTRKLLHSNTLRKLSVLEIVEEIEEDALENREARTKKIESEEEADLKAKDTDPNEDGSETLTKGNDDDILTLIDKIEAKEEEEINKIGQKLDDIFSGNSTADVRFQASNDGSDVNEGTINGNEEGQISNDERKSSENEEERNALDNNGISYSVTYNPEKLRQEIAGKVEDTDTEGKEKIDVSVKIGNCENIALNVDGVDNVNIFNDDDTHKAISYNSDALRQEIEGKHSKDEDTSEKNDDLKNANGLDNIIILNNEDIQKTISYNLDALRQEIEGKHSKDEDTSEKNDDLKNANDLDNTIISNDEDIKKTISYNPDALRQEIEGKKDDDKYENNDDSKNANDVDNTIILNDEDIQKIISYNPDALRQEIEGKHSKDEDTSEKNDDLKNANDLDSTIILNDEDIKKIISYNPDALRQEIEGKKDDDKSENDDDLKNANDVDNIIILNDEDIKKTISYNPDALRQEIEGKKDDDKSERDGDLQNANDVDNGIILNDEDIQKSISYNPDVLRQEIEGKQTKDEDTSEKNDDLKNANDLDTTIILNDEDIKKTISYNQDALRQEIEGKHTKDDHKSEKNDDLKNANDLDSTIILNDEDIKKNISYNPDALRQEIEGKKDDDKSENDDDLKNANDVDNIIILNDEDIQKSISYNPDILRQEIEGKHTKDEDTSEKNDNLESANDLDSTIILNDEDIKKNISYNPDALRQEIEGKKDDDKSENNDDLKIANDVDTIIILNDEDIPKTISYNPDALRQEIEGKQSKDEDKSEKNNDIKNVNELNNIIILNDDDIQKSISYNPDALRQEIEGKHTKDDDKSEKDGDLKNANDVDNIIILNDEDILKTISYDPDALRQEIEGKHSKDEDKSEKNDDLKNANDMNIVILNDEDIQKTVSYNPDELRQEIEGKHSKDEDKTEKYDDKLKEHGTDNESEKEEKRNIPISISYDPDKLKQEIEAKNGNKDIIIQENGVNMSESGKNEKDIFEEKKIEEQNKNKEKENDALNIVLTMEENVREIHEKPIISKTYHAVNLKQELEVDDDKIEIDVCEDDKNKSEEDVVEVTETHHDNSLPVISVSFDAKKLRQEIEGKTDKEEEGKTDKEKEGKSEIIKAIKTNDCEDIGNGNGEQNKDDSEEIKFKISYNPKKLKEEIHSQEDKTDDKDQNELHLKNGEVTTDGDKQNNNSETNKIEADSHNRNILEKHSEDIVDSIGNHLPNSEKPIGNEKVEPEEKKNMKSKDQNVNSKEQNVSTNYETETVKSMPCNPDENDAEIETRKNVNETNETQNANCSENLNQVSISYDPARLRQELEGEKLEDQIVKDQNEEDEEIKIEEPIKNTNAVFEEIIKPISITYNPKLLAQEIYAEEKQGDGENNETEGKGNEKTEMHIKNEKDKDSENIISDTKEKQNGEIPAISISYCPDKVLETEEEKDGKQYDEIDSIANIEAIKESKDDLDTAQQEIQTNAAGENEIESEKVIVTEKSNESSPENKNENKHVDHNSERTNELKQKKESTTGEINAKKLIESKHGDDLEDSENNEDLTVLNKHVNNNDIELKKSSSITYDPVKLRQEIESKEDEIVTNEDDDVVEEIPPDNRNNIEKLISSESISYDPEKLRQEIEGKEEINLNNKTPTIEEDNNKNMEGTNGNGISKVDNNDDKENNPVDNADQTVSITYNPETLRQEIESKDNSNDNKPKEILNGTCHELPIDEAIVKKVQISYCPEKLKQEIKGEEENELKANNHKKPQIDNHYCIPDVISVDDLVEPFMHEDNSTNSTSYNPEKLRMELQIGVDETDLENQVNLKTDLKDEMVTSKIMEIKDKNDPESISIPTNLVSYNPEKLRKELEIHNDLFPALEHEENVKIIYPYEVVLSAVRIQKVFRGFRERKKFKSLKNQDLRANEDNAREGKNDNIGNASINGFRAEQKNISENLKDDASDGTAPLIEKNEQGEENGQHESKGHDGKDDRNGNNKQNENNKLSGVQSGAPVNTAFPLNSQLSDDNDFSDNEVSISDENTSSLVHTSELHDSFISEPQSNEKPSVNLSEDLKLESKLSSEDNSGMLHSSEFHDGVILTFEEKKEEELDGEDTSSLLHSSEFHDLIVLNAQEDNLENEKEPALFVTVEDKCEDHYLDESKVSQEAKTPTQEEEEVSLIENKSSINERKGPSEEIDVTVSEKEVAAEDTEINQRAQSSAKSKEIINPEDQANAAIKIQKTFRRHLSKTNLLENVEVDKTVEDHITPLKEEDNVVDNIESDSGKHVAASKIQKTFRRHLSRSNLLEPSLTEQSSTSQDMPIKELEEEGITELQIDENKIIDKEINKETGEKINNESEIAGEEIDENVSSPKTSSNLRVTPPLSRPLSMDSVVSTKSANTVIFMLSDSSSPRGEEPAAKNSDLPKKVRFELGEEDVDKKAVVERYLNDSLAHNELPERRVISSNEAEFDQLGEPIIGVGNSRDNKENLAAVRIQGFFRENFSNNQEINKYQTNKQLTVNQETTLKDSSKPQSSKRNERRGVNEMPEGGYPILKNDDYRVIGNSGLIKLDDSDIAKSDMLKTSPNDELLVLEDILKQSASVNDQEACVVPESVKEYIESVICPLPVADLETTDTSKVEDNIEKAESVKNEGSQNHKVSKEINLPKEEKLSANDKVTNEDNGTKDNKVLNKPQSLSEDDVKTTPRDSIRIPLKDSTSNEIKEEFASTSSDTSANVEGRSNVGVCTSENGMEWSHRQLNNEQGEAPIYISVATATVNNSPNSDSSDLAYVTTVQIPTVHVEQTSGLSYTGEFHDVPIVFPNPPTTEPSTQDFDASPVDTTNAPTSGELQDNVLPLAIQMNQSPAGDEVLTSSGSASSVSKEGCTQASGKDASSFESASDASRSSSELAMESADKRNNATMVSKNQESEAATKIQASFRGYQVRKNMKNKTGQETKSNRRSARRKSSARLTENKNAQTQAKDLEEKSATKIQAGIRGFLVRKRQKNNKKAGTAQAS